MDKNIEDEVKMIDAHVQGEPEEEIYHVYTVPGGVVILRQGEIPEDQTATVIDSEPATEPETTIPSTPLPTKQHSEPVTTALISVLLLAMFVPLFCLLVQFSMLFNPYTVTFTLLTKSQHITVNGTLQLGRVISPLTLSQSQTVHTTGKGHQDAKQATGLLTLYNAAFTLQTVDAGTIYTGSDGIAIVTNETVTIPADNPPVIGQVSVQSHAVNAGSQGNIQALDINYAVSNSLYVKNLAAFTSGQDERNFQTVAKSDIENAAAPLKATLAESLQGALQGQLKQGEELQTFPCSPSVTPDHQMGQEATQVKITVSETCGALAYNDQELTSTVTQLLTAQAVKKLGEGYSLLDTPQITITHATPGKKVTLSFTSVSTWVYGVSSQQQRHIKEMIAGKTTQQALQLLNRLPGVESASLQFSGFGDTSRTPKNIAHIRLMFIYNV